MIDPYKVYEPRKNKILPYYADRVAWKNEIEVWKQNYHKDPESYDQGDLDDFFYSAFSIGDYKSYKEIAQTIDREQEKLFTFHNSTALAIELYKKGKYLKAKDCITLAIQSKDPENRLHFYIFQLRKENQLKIELEKRKGLNKKIKYLNTKYFEISGNILYSTDLYGTKILLNLLTRKQNNTDIQILSTQISLLFEKTINFKGNMSLYPKELIGDELEELYIHLKKLEDNKKLDISFIHWKILSKIIGISENIEQYYNLRNISKKILLDNLYKYNKKHNVFTLYGLRAQLENGTKAEFSNILNPDNYEIAIAYAKLYEKKTYDFLKIIKKYETEKDSIYGKAIKNKRVAIVGPVEHEIENGYEIDSYDVVIRLNVVDIEKYNAKKFGRKTTATSFVREVLVKNYSQVINNLTQKEFIFFNSYLNDPLVKKLENKRQVRQIIKYDNRRNNILFSGYLTHIQRVIFDTLRFEPAEIKIFNTNLWLEINKNNHYHYQQKFDSTILILHDIFSNFDLMQKMYKNNYIKVDQVLEKILNLSMNQYCKEMIAKYVD